MPRSGHYMLLLLLLPFAFAAAILPATNGPVFRPPRTGPKRVAVVGAGAAGSAAAFFLRRAAEAAEVAQGLALGSLLGEIVVFEKEGHVGGRSTVVYPHNDMGNVPVELGATIFVEANRNLMKAIDMFNLNAIQAPGSAQFMVWDGTNIVFSYMDVPTRFPNMSAINSNVDAANDLVLDHFASLYDAAWLASRGPVASIEAFADTAGLGVNITNVTGLQWALDVGAGMGWAREMMGPIVRVNYARNMDQTHALGAAVSLGHSGSLVVEGGNFQVFERMLTASGAQLHLNTEVVDILPPCGTGDVFHIVHRASAGSAAVTVDAFDQVFFGAPWHDMPGPGRVASVIAPKIPQTTYVTLHVTLLTTPSSSANPSYFGTNGTIPPMVLTMPGGTTEPEILTIVYNGETTPGSGEYVVKLFSFARLPDATLAALFGNVTWVHRKEWQSYPALEPITTYPPAEPVDGFHYLASLEPWLSTMETQTVSAREAVARVAQRWWGLGLGNCTAGQSWDLTCDI